MKILRIVGVLGLILGLISAGIAAESQRIATVAQTEGKVEVKSEKGKWIPATVGMVLNQGDIVRTRKNSSARLNLDGNAQTATVEVKENSQLALAELIIDKQRDTQKTPLDLAVGGILIKARKLHSKASSFEVKTPTSIVGVRGTTFAVSVEAVE